MSLPNESNVTVFWEEDLPLKLKYLSANVWFRIPGNANHGGLYLTREKYDPHGNFRACYKTEEGHTVKVMEEAVVEVCDVKITSVPKK